MATDRAFAKLRRATSTSEKVS
ncbi:MAG TPA: hypothetical protein VGR34_01980 [Candidatus Dormibacteraeota bacterium]|nr:hypothetical protein [Candidatus Dormibacteraeota bacterium]